MGVLDIRSAHTWYWGLEIMVERTDVSSGNYTDCIRIGDEARFNKIINCVIHDATNSGIADQDGVAVALAARNF